MPGKSRHAKKKHFQRSMKSAARQPVAAGPQPPQAVDGPPQPSAPVSKPVSASAPAPSRVSGIVQQHPYIGRELRNIGILTVIVLVILVVLSRVLS